MNLSQVRDMVRSILVQPGSEQKWRIPMPLIDQVINSQCQVHFENTKSLTGYWQTLAVEGQDEYNLPEGIVAPTLIKIDENRYFPAPFPYIDGVELDDEDRFFWVEGDKFRIVPEPSADTATYTTGTVSSITGSIVTITTGTLGATNVNKRYLVLLGSNYYIITANSTTTFTVDGTPAGTETTFTIYEPGIQIWGIRRPDDLTAGSDDAIPGTDVDAMSIAYATALEIAMTLPETKQRAINIQGIDALHSQYFRRAMKSNNVKTFTPISITPWTLRTDQSGLK